MKMQLLNSSSSTLHPNTLAKKKNCFSYWLMKNLGKGMCLSVSLCVHAHTHKHIHLSEYGYMNACVCGWTQADNLTAVPQVCLLLCLLLLASTGITVCPVVWHRFSETVVQSLQAFYCLSFIILGLRTQDSLGKSEHIPRKLPMLETQSPDLHINGVWRWDCRVTTGSWRPFCPV